MWNSSIVQSSILSLGKMKDFQCHNMEHQLCAYTDCNHGMALAVIHPAYYRQICKYAPEKFARFGVNVLGLNSAGKTEEALSLASRLKPKQLQEFMGHERISTTIEIYVKSIDKDRKAVAL